MGIPVDIPRAEFPPARYWRRWCADADPPKPPLESAELESHAIPVAPPGPAAEAARSGEAPYRVLIVEDDRSQALFATSVLAGAGIQAEAVADPEQVMATLESQRPDLVLMDLHMPAIDGAELTNMIRSHSVLSHTPIVFLTGDPDPERQFEVLEIGADDFLTKPVRPRHLVAAVENRIMRARQLKAQRAAQGADTGTGLHTRSRMFQRLATAIPNDTGALHVVEVAGISALREQLGYSSLEDVLTAAARRVAELAGDNPAARLNDNTFLVHVSGDGDLEAFARELRDGLGRERFGSGADGLRLRACVGSTRITPEFPDAGSALAAAEQALRDARAAPHGLATWTTPQSTGNATGGLAEQISTALAERRLELAFQPIVAVAGGEDAQYQTLLRMRDDGGALLPASTLLPAAEAAGLMHEVDRQVLELAISTLARRQSAGAPVRLFVSQSPRSLGRDGYAEWLLEAMQAAGVSGHCLVIDVRQDDALIHAISLQEFSAKMVPAGVQLCLGHYRPGTEVDALLSQLPLGFVRLAPDFSSGLTDNSVRDRMREAIDRAHRSGLLVIGQQVEDPQAAATLWMSGIDFIQGNLVQEAAGDLEFDFQHSVL